MTADSEMPSLPEKYDVHVRKIDGDHAINPVYVDHLESRLARTEAALKVAKEALTAADEAMLFDVGGEPLYSLEIAAREKLKVALAQIAALEGKHE